MPDRAAEVVAAMDRDRDTDAGRLKDPGGRGLWIREAPPCAAVRAGEGLPVPVSSRMYVPTAAEISARGRVSAEVPAQQEAKV